MDASVFMDKAQMPSENDLKQVLGEKHKLWMEIRKRVLHAYPGASESWNFPGKKYGWSYRIRDNKRAIIYFLPRERAFMVAFVFGGKATDAILDSEVSEEIKTELKNAKDYAEGRGIRIPVQDRESLEDIFHLIDFKLAY
jgi:hypothetical protein